MGEWKVSVLCSATRWGNSEVSRWVFGRLGLIRKMNDAGFGLVQIFNYCFPLSRMYLVLVSRASVHHLFMFSLFV